MAEGDIHHPAIGEIQQVFQITLKGESVLYAQHDTLQPLVLVYPEVGWATGNGNIVFIRTDNLLDLIEDQVGIGLRAWHLEAHVV